MVTHCQFQDRVRENVGDSAMGGGSLTLLAQVSAQSI